MAFVRPKKVTATYKGKSYEYEYYQVVENHRVQGKPRQKFLVHLGKHTTLEAAIEAQEIKYSQAMTIYDPKKRLANKHRDTINKLVEVQKNHPYLR